MSVYDLCVIGGGINGAGIARDAAGRGLSVLLLEKSDLASGTSSASTKLIHGGLRYLENYEFKMVAEALREREILLSIAPHIMKPMEFVLPVDKSMRPAWMIGMGLTLYDNLAPRKSFSASRRIRIDKAGDAYFDLKPDFRKAFVYSDGWVDDARLVVLNAMDAAARGADVRTHTPCTYLQQDKGLWNVEMGHADDSKVVQARAVINASGPWLTRVMDRSAVSGPADPDVRLVRGSHIIVPRPSADEHTYILQQSDGRIVFVIPYEQNFTLIGTTEVEIDDPDSQAVISPDEIAYLCDAHNKAFRAQISADDVVKTYSGVRPLMEDGQESATKASRDYQIFTHKGHEAPLFSIYGGKLTTYRRVAEEAVNQICRALGNKAPTWTASQPLPGGDVRDVKEFKGTKAARYSWLPPALLERYAGSYGQLMDHFLASARSLEDLGAHYGDNVYEAELRYLVREEFARAADDVLWRRSKLGLHVAEETKMAIDKALPDIVREELKL